jgi:uncharacterized damage-inducible protein DinB
MSQPLALDDLRYPIGRWDRRPAEDAELPAAIAALEELPERLSRAVAGLDDERLDTPYREGGWTVRQLVHHVADSHVNAYTRFRLALTEDDPAIKTYDEARWAELADARTAPVESSLALLAALHERWTRLVRTLGPADLERAVRHPEHGLIGLRHLLALYAWHSRHHVAHVTRLRERMGW